MFESWLRIRQRCVRCRLRTDRGEPDYYFGAWVIGFVAAEGLVVLIGVVAILATWPAVPWGRVQLLMIALVLPVPILTIPFSRTVWLAVDLTLRPPRSDDFFPAD